MLQSRYPGRPPYKRRQCYTNTKNNCDTPHQKCHLGAASIKLPGGKRAWGGGLPKFEIAINTVIQYPATLTLTTLTKGCEDNRFNPLYSSGLSYSYIMDESICHFRGVGSIYRFYSISNGKSCQQTV